MICAKIRPQGLFDSGEIDFQRFLPYMGIAATLVNGPWPFYQSFIPLPQGGSTWNLSNTCPEAWEEKSFEIINIFSIQKYGADTNAYESKLDLAVKKSNINVQLSF